MLKSELGIAARLSGVSIILGTITVAVMFLDLPSALIRSAIWKIRVLASV